MAEGIKRCTRCEQMQPHGEFTRDRTRLDGYFPWCKSCKRETQARWYAENQSAIRKRRRIQLQENPALRIAQQKRSQQWRAANREAYLADLRRRYQANKAAYKAKAAAWNRAHPEYGRERARRHAARKRAAIAGTTTPNLIVAKFAYWGNRCWMCGGEAIEADHVKPLSAGGLHCLANIRPACRSCNAQKMDRWPYPDALKGGPLYGKSRKVGPHCRSETLPARIQGS